MKPHLTLLAAAASAVALTVAAPSFADSSSQLAASAGLNPVEAAGLSLSEIAQAKFNRDARGDSRPLSVVHNVSGPDSRARLAANAGIDPEAAQAWSLTEVAAAKFNRDSGGDDQQRVRLGTATMASRSVDGQQARTQLIGSAGLRPDAAVGLSLTEIAQAKFDHDGAN